MLDRLQQDTKEDGARMSSAEVGATDVVAGDEGVDGEAEVVARAVVTTHGRELGKTRTRQSRRIIIANGDMIGKWQEEGLCLAHPLDLLYSSGSSMHKHCRETTCTFMRSHVCNIVSQGMTHIHMYGNDSENTA